MSQPDTPPRKRLLVIHRGTRIGSPEGQQVRGFLMCRRHDDFTRGGFVDDVRSIIGFSEVGTPVGEAGMCRG